MINDNIKLKMFVSDGACNSCVGGNSDEDCIKVSRLASEQHLRPCKGNIVYIEDKNYIKYKTVECKSTIDRCKGCIRNKPDIKFCGCFIEKMKSVGLKGCDYSNLIYIKEKL